MVPESLNWPFNPYLAGAIVLCLGLLAAAIGAQIKRRTLERHRNEVYVRRRRGEEVLPDEPPRLAGVLLYAGGAVGALGIVILVLAWTLTPGQS